MIPAYRSQGGTRYYSSEQLNIFLGIGKLEAGKNITIGYCRVSSKKQKDDLERQVEHMRTYLISQGKSFEIISDIGSGINYKNRGLNQLLDRVVNGEIEKIVILYKDRLVRFGFELIGSICTKFDTTIEIINSTEKTGEQDLSIIGL